MEQCAFNVCGYRRPKLYGFWNNVKCDFKVSQNIGELSTTGEKINVSGPEKQENMSPNLPLRK